MADASVDADVAERPADPVKASDPVELFSHESTRHVALTVVAIAAGVFLLQLMQAILIPFVLAGLLFYALSPAVERLQRIFIPRALAAGLMLAAFTGALGLVVYTLQDQAMTVINELPEGARKIAAMLDGPPADEPGPIDKVQEAADELQATTDGPRPRSGVMRVQVEQPRFQASAFFWTSSIGAVFALNQFLMILFLTFFMLVSSERIKLKLIQVAGPTLSRKKVTVQILDEMGGRIEKFLLVQILTSALVAIATWAVLMWLGLEQAALWGLLAGILNSIPYYGPLLVTAGLSVIGFLQFGTISHTLMVAGAALSITTLEGMALTPILLGRVARMNHVAVFAGLLFWSWAWGVWGILLAVPMMMIMKTVCDHVEDLKPIGTILGE